MITPLKPEVCRGERWPTKDEMVAMLRQSVNGWNLWRAKHPQIERIDLNGVNLSDLELAGVNLSCAELRGADLRGSDLTDADLHLADVDGANFYGTDLTGAHTFACKGLPAEIRLKHISELIESWEYD